MSVWGKYTREQQEEYIDFLKMYGALSAMFNQKSSETGAPYLDSKFQETVYAKSFNSEDVDIGNTPHDIRSSFNNSVKIGIGIKTWLNSKPSFQKVMQLKQYKSRIDQYKDQNQKDDLAIEIAKIKNHRLKTDYGRLGLKERGNIYHYVTRDEGKMVIQETSYPMVDMDTLKPGKLTEKSFTFTDRLKTYKYTFGDSQIWMKFGEENDKTVIDEVKVNILDDPFGFLKTAFSEKKGIMVPKRKLDYTYLPLYSYNKHSVQPKSGLNAFNGAPKSLGGGRPTAEVYIPIPKEYLKKHAFWFNSKIDMRDYRAYKLQTGENSFKFTLHLPNGKSCPALVGQQGFKALETAPQEILGKWLLYTVLGLQPKEIVTDQKLQDVGFDSVKLWHEDPTDYSQVWIDFAPLGSFERYMREELTGGQDDGLV